MIIANPIYDTVFKRLMENRRIAQFFIQTLIGEQIEEITVLPQEITYVKEKAKGEKKDDEKKEEDVNVKEEVFSIIRLDYVATICTEQGEYKKVLIEIQKSQKPSDLERFRTYLGEKYKETDIIKLKIGKGKEEKTLCLPIIGIYLLGFNIPKQKAPAIRVNRSYWDMINQKKINQKSNFIEALTHDGYFVQIKRIKGKPRTLLEQLLSVFEQEYFIDKNIIKEYAHPIDHEIIQEMIDTLGHVAASPKERRVLEAEWFAKIDEEEYEKMKEEIAENVKTIAEKNKTIAEKDNTIAEKDNTIAELQHKIAEMQKK